MTGGLATSNTMTTLINSTLAQEIRDNAVNYHWGDAVVVDYPCTSFWRRLCVGFMSLPPIRVSSVKKVFYEKVFVCNKCDYMQCCHV